MHTGSRVFPKGGDSIVAPDFPGIKSELGEIVRIYHQAGRVLHSDARHGGRDFEDFPELVISSDDLLYLLVTLAYGLVHFRYQMSACLRHKGLDVRLVLGQALFTSPDRQGDLLLDKAVAIQEHLAETGQGRALRLVGDHLVMVAHGIFGNGTGVCPVVLDALYTGGVLDTVDLVYVLSVTICETIFDPQRG